MRLAQEQDDEEALKNRGNHPEGEAVFVLATTEFCYGEKANSQLILTAFKILYEQERMMDSNTVFRQ